MHEPCRWSATECIARLRRGKVSPVELVEAAIARIEAVDPAVNALPVRCFERALALPLAGLPIAVKDYSDVGGRVPPTARLEANGAIPLAKSNVPEWAGGNTVDPVLGLPCGFTADRSATDRVSRRLARRRFLRRHAPRWVRPHARAVVAGKHRARALYLEFPAGDFPRSDAAWSEAVGVRARLPGDVDGPREPGVLAPGVADAKMAREALRVWHSGRAARRAAR